MKSPSVPSSVFVAPNATVVGDVQLGEEASVWFGAVLRGDADAISVGARSNVQDLAVIHTDPGFPVRIGEEVIVGHGAVVHGACIGDNSLIGIRATLLNGVKIGKYCVIGAHALLTEGTEIPDFSVVLGAPGKVVKTVSEAQKEKLLKNAAAYVALAKRYMREIEG